MANTPLTEQRFIKILDERLDKKLTNFATKEYLDGKLSNFATKDDLKSFATKEDLKGFATKEDIKNFATKEDLKSFATKDDLKGFVTEEFLKKELEKQTKELQAYTDEQTDTLGAYIAETIALPLEELKKDWKLSSLPSKNVVDSL